MLVHYCGTACHQGRRRVGDQPGSRSGIRWSVKFPCRFRRPLVQGQDVAEGWPLRSYLDLAALPNSVPRARLHARQMVREWGLGELSDNLELVVSELMTNSVRASVGLAGSWHDGRWRSGVPPVRLWHTSELQSPC